LRKLGLLLALLAYVAGGQQISANEPQTDADINIGGESEQPILPIYLGVGPDFATTTPRALEDTSIHDLRVKKCERIILTFYNYRNSDGSIARANFLPYVNYFISYHEELERNGGNSAAGFGATWYWSLVYGGANFGMRCYGVAPGNCAGPLDVKHYPLILDPEENIRYHCNEMLSYYKRGVRNRRLCEWVFYPAAPRDWGGGRFRMTDAKHRECIARGYAVGKLP